MDTCTESNRAARARRRTTLVAFAVVVGGLLPLPGSGAALAPPDGAFSFGASGNGGAGGGGEFAPSPTTRAWPGTGNTGNGGPFAFVGAQYGSLWKIPPSTNNSRGVGYCVMEDVDGVGAVARRADPDVWDVGEMARAAAVMATFGGDRVVPYGITATGAYDVATGEWKVPALLGGGTYTRRRQIAVNLATRMFLEDLSPTGAAKGLKVARDTSVVNGRGADFAALSSGYGVARALAAVAERQHAVGGLVLTVQWDTKTGEPPTVPGTYRVEVLVTDSRGKPVGFVPVWQLSAVGVGDHHSVAAIARADHRGDTADDAARQRAAAAAGWPNWAMNLRLDRDPRFAVAARADAADVADSGGVARFNVEITAATWSLAFHAQAPTSDVALYTGTGVQGQITWAGTPQSASVSIGRTVAATTTTIATTTAPSTTTAPTTSTPGTSTSSTSTSSTSTSTTSTSSTSTSISTTSTTVAPASSSSAASTSSTPAPSTGPPTTSDASPPTEPPQAPPAVPSAPPLPPTGSSATDWIAFVALVALAAGALSIELTDRHRSR